MTFVCFRRDNGQFEVPPFLKFLLRWVALDCSAVFSFTYFTGKIVLHLPGNGTRTMQGIVIAVIMMLMMKTMMMTRIIIFIVFIIIIIVVIVIVNVIVIVIFIVIVKVPISSKLLFPHLILNFMQWTSAKFFFGLDKKRFLETWKSYFLAVYPCRWSQDRHAQIYDVDSGTCDFRLDWLILIFPLYAVRIIHGLLRRFVCR